MYKHMKHIPECVRSLVSGDFFDACLYDEPEKMTVAAAREYWDEFISNLKEVGRFVPRSLSPEIYVQLWNEELDLYDARRAQ